MIQTYGVETCSVCKRSVPDDEVDNSNGICDECIQTLPDDVRRLREENRKLKADIGVAVALLREVQTHSNLQLFSSVLPCEGLSQESLPLRMERGRIE